MSVKQLIKKYSETSETQLICGNLTVESSAQVQQRSNYDFDDRYGVFITSILSYCADFQKIHPGFEASLAPQTPSLEFLTTFIVRYGYCMEQHIRNVKTFLLVKRMLNTFGGQPKFPHNPYFFMHADLC